MRINCGARKGLKSTLKETCMSFVASLHCPGVQLDYVRYAKLQLIFETKNWDPTAPSWVSVTCSWWLMASASN